MPCPCEPTSDTANCYASQLPKVACEHEATDSAMVQVVGMHCVQSPLASLRGLVLVSHSSNGRPVCTGGDSYHLIARGPNAHFASLSAPMGSEQLLSIVEEAARRWLLTCPLEDRQKAPKRAIDCYKGLMHEVQRLRTPLAFSQAPESIVVSDNRMEVAKEINCGWRAASCGVTMRAGRHFAQFTLLRGSPSCGIIRPGWDVLIDKGDLTGHCFFEAWLGTRCELLAARFHFAVFLCRCAQNWSALLVQCP